MLSAFSVFLLTPFPLEAFYLLPFPLGYGASVTCFLLGAYCFSTSWKEVVWAWGVDSKLTNEVCARRKTGDRFIINEAVSEAGRLPAFRFLEVLSREIGSSLT